MKKAKIFMKQCILADYSLIGNSRSAALVSKYGSIDWCCLPEFHSSSIFAALLDKTKGGYFCISPAGEFACAQKYISDTNVLDTNFKTADGEVRLLDAFTAMTEQQKSESLFPDHEILRIVEGISGSVKMKLEYVPRVFYGKSPPRLKDRQKLGISFSSRENVYNLGSTLDPRQIRVSADQSSAHAEFSVNGGERVCFSLSYSDQGPAVLPELKVSGFRRLQQTILFWKNWIRKCTYAGDYGEQVRRSALALKLLEHAPSGAIIAAPTTSLPEKIGGERNWDYRYCWLRDASFTIRALVKLGFEEEAHAYMNWILHATRLTRPRLQVVYSVFGHAYLKENTLDWLSGYKNSRPVRIGNLADGQFQLDIYGEVLDAVYTYAPIVKQFDSNSKAFIIGLGKVICKVWEQPDNGIWEIRSSSVQHTHSKVLAWAGLDRLLKLCEKYQWTEAPIAKFRETAARIRNDIEQWGYNVHLGAYAREFNGSHLDASLLVLPLIEYCDAASPRMRSTVEKICERLLKNNLLYRYREVDDGVSGEEGSFGVCNFWLIENLVKSGKVDKGIEIFETMLKHASPTGLFSEEINPDTHELLGNYPQGFTHIGLINAALTIESASQT
jgi:GH15 family glucan-1,4-alpha-glucosidase